MQSTNPKSSRFHPVQVLVQPELKHNLILATGAERHALRVVQSLLRLHVRGRWGLTTLEDVAINEYLLQGGIGRCYGRYIVSVHAKCSLLIEYVTLIGDHTYVRMAAPRHTRRRGRK